MLRMILGSPLARTGHTLYICGKLLLRSCRLRRWSQIQYVHTSTPVSRIRLTQFEIRA